MTCAGYVNRVITQATGVPDALRRTANSSPHGAVLDAEDASRPGSRSLRHRVTGARDQHKDEQQYGPAKEAPRCLKRSSIGGMSGYTFAVRVQKSPYRTIFE